MAVSGIAGSAVLASYAPFFSPHEKLGHQVDFALDVGDNLAPPPGLLKARWVMAEKRGRRMREKRPTADPHERLRQLLIDCGCTAHMVGDVKYLSKVTQVRPDRSVRIANGKIMPVTHVGEAIVSVNGIRRVKRKGKITMQRTIEDMHLSQVLVVPGLATTLFSCHSAFECDSIETHLNDKRALVLPSGSEVHFADGTGKKYEVHAAGAQGKATECAAAAQASCSVHEMLAHVSPDRIDMARTRSQGLPIPPAKVNATARDCKPCAVGGSVAPSFSHKWTPHVQRGKFGDSVSSDICGPFPTAVKTGFKFAIGFADRETRLVAVYFLTDQNAESVQEAIKTYIADYGHLMTKGAPKQFVSDNGGGYVAKSTDELLNSLLTKKALSVPYAPQRNSQIERFWYTLNRHTRILLAAAGHSAALWPFAMSHIVDVHNALPTRALSPPIAPDEAVTGKIPNLAKFKDRVWGCDTVVHLRKDEREHKLSPTGVSATFLGLDNRRRGEWHFIPSLNTIKCVVKATKYYPTSFTTIRLTPSPLMDIREERDIPQGHLIGNHPVALAVPTAGNSRLPTATTLVPLNTANPHVLTYGASLALSELPENSTLYSSGFFADAFAVDAEAAANDLEALAPSAHRDIYGRRDEKEWLEAEIADIKAKMGNGAFEVVRISDVPQGRRLVKSKFAYKYKRDAVTNNISERRARFVGCGYSQAAGYDFDETSCGTLRGASVRSLLCKAAIDDLDIYCGDVVKAFTQSKLDKEIYVMIPPQFNMPGKCFKAIMSLEGLKQSGYLFQVEAFAQVRKLNGVQSKVDPNIWYIGQGAERITVGFWVDDVMILTPCGRRDLADKFWEGFRKRFKCDELKVPSKFVGLEIKRNRQAKTITITQSLYIDTMFDKFLAGDHTKQRK